MIIDDLSAATLEKALPKFEKLLAEVVTDIPASGEKKAPDPEAAARALAAAAARKTAALSGVLALPPGPLGVLTMIPDLIGVWRLQAQLVADVAAVYGKTAQLNRELMTYCLFRHVSSDAVKDIVVRAGERVVVSFTSILMLYRVLRFLLGEVISLMAGRFMVRWFPALGAASLAAYAYRDTKRVGETAIETFSSKIESAAPKRKHRRST